MGVFQSPLTQMFPYFEIELVMKLLLAMYAIPKPNWQF